MIIKLLTGQPGSHVLSVDYRGFGDSSWAVPTQEGLIMDSIAAYEWLLKQGVNPSKIILTGHSLGTGVATNLARHLDTERKDYASLLLLSAYASIGDAAIGYGTVPLLGPIHGIPFLESFFKSNMIDTWLSFYNIRHVLKPILIIHGKSDGDVQPWQAQALFIEAASARLNTVWIDSHWDLRNMYFSPDGKFKVERIGEGEVWMSGNVMLLLVDHAGHNSLSKFLVVEDAILSLNTI